ncbi:MAG: YihA family ribosome biogenesis GTP-binding protein, partial [Rhizobiales bacterium]|nr:YihA family ribosome biogenesis GTP-binding protein [Hyphomicrobiales bacterium]
MQDATDSGFSPDEMEAGRLMFARDWQFRYASPSLETLPPMDGVEIAFAGRSNVGKSSLINGLTGRKALARTSHTPGRTQELIFFRTDGPLAIVDMPGYGYAEVTKSKVRAWTDLIHAYLRGRANLARVYVLIDARHGIKDTDRPVFDTLDKAAVSYAVVLTKCDQLKPPARAARLAEVTAALKGHAAAFPDVIATSSHTADGMPE